jgi:hypothetical protein
MLIFVKILSQHSLPVDEDKHGESLFVLLRAGFKPSTC